MSSALAEGPEGGGKQESDRFYCPYPGCKRSFAELWRLKVHYRAPPDIRGSGKERGHGTELTHCPKCGKALKPGKHHVGCSAGKTAPRQASKRSRVQEPVETDGLEVLLDGQGQEEAGDGRMFSMDLNVSVNYGANGVGPPSVRANGYVTQSYPQQGQGFQSFPQQAPDGSGALYGDLQQQQQQQQQSQVLVQPQQQQQQMSSYDGYMTSHTGAQPLGSMMPNLYGAPSVSAPMQPQQQQQQPGMVGHLDLTSSTSLQHPQQHQQQTMYMQSPPQQQQPQQQQQQAYQHVGGYQMPPPQQQQMQLAQPQLQLSPQEQQMQGLPPSGLPAGTPGYGLAGHEQQLQQHPQQQMSQGLVQGGGEVQYMQAPGLPVSTMPSAAPGAQYQQQQQQPSLPVMADPAAAMPHHQQQQQQQPGSMGPPAPVFQHHHHQQQQQLPGSMGPPLPPQEAAAAAAAPMGSIPGLPAMGGLDQQQQQHAVAATGPPPPQQQQQPPAASSFATMFDEHEYDLLERIPSPPPLPTDFNPNGSNAGMLFNFSQFNQKLPAATPVSTTMMMPPDMEPSLQQTVADLWSPDMTFDHHTDGDLMQLLFGAPDQPPNMATIHLHHFLDELEPSSPLADMDHALRPKLPPSPPPPSPPPGPPPGVAGGLGSGGGLQMGAGFAGQQQQQQLGAPVMVKQEAPVVAGGLQQVPEAGVPAVVLVKQEVAAAGGYLNGCTQEAQKNCLMNGIAQVERPLGVCGEHKDAAEL